ncbi:MAG: coproporphyrinogen III oxidase family protein [Alphaproteobacteria bacterium]|nr:coproporphyrinogen III oxidase family protein [Alphaproteobacteria bacterium]
MTSTLDTPTPDAARSPLDAAPGFVANYPPFGAWTPDAMPAIEAALDAPPRPDTPLGLYVHVPFCRKRCRFCYFKVYTERPSAEIRAYVEGLAAEAALYARRRVVDGRKLAYVYVGGGTPSYLSGDQIRQLFDGLRASFDWDTTAELTYECEPGTVRPAKMEALAAHGVTRVSLGVESWDEALLELNGRAHGARHIEPAYAMARDAGIPQVNIDLIAGMVGETEATWQAGVERTIALEPDSVTIYQMEIPANTALFRALKGEEDLGGTLADVATRRRWASEAFEALVAAGYTMTSGYTAVRGDPDGKFVYRNALWQGADMIPLGVSAFGQLSGVHIQNDKHLPQWLERVGRGELPVQRGYAMSDDDRLVREVILQLKLGRLDRRPFAAKFGVDIFDVFDGPFRRIERAGFGARDGDVVTLTWDGLMQVDALLPAFFLDVHGGDVQGPFGMAMARRQEVRRGA